MQEVTAPPTSQVCSICWTWPALGLWRCNAGSGCLLDVVGWDLWGWNAGLVERKANFKKIVNRMGRWPGYGGSAVAMGEWPAYGDLPRCMGRCGRRVVVWERRETYGEMACVEGRRIAWGAAKTYGKCHGIWETAPVYGEAARPHGEPKITLNPEYGNCGGLRTLHIFMNFGGNGDPVWEAVEMYGDQ